MQDGYRRQSRVCAPSELHAPLAAEMKKVADAQAIGDLAAASRYCIETRSERAKAPGFFARMMGTGDMDVEHYTAVVLTRAAVLVGVSGQQRGTRVFFLPLESLLLEDPLGVPALGIAFKSPILGGPQGPGSYSVFFGSGDAKEQTREAVKRSLTELRAG